jgi:hypothetical protein
MAASVVGMLIQICQDKCRLVYFLEADSKFLPDRVKRLVKIVIKI